MYIKSGQKATMTSDQCCICLGEKYLLYYSFHFSRSLTNCKIKSWGGERIQRQRSFAAWSVPVLERWGQVGRGMTGSGLRVFLALGSVWRWYLQAWVPGRCQRRGIRGPWNKCHPLLQSYPRHSQSAQPWSSPLSVSSSLHEAVWRPGPVPLYRPSSRPAGLMLGQSPTF